MFNPSQQQLATLLPEGTILKGRYRVHHYLSSGGFGNTYYANDTNLSNKVVAIKEFFVKGMAHREDDQRTVTVSNATNKDQFESLRAKFYKEAQRMANLGDCDHVCSVTDFFEENDTSYYVMQYIDGVSLAKRVKEEGPIRESEVRRILDQMLDALEDIHSKNIYHFDIKPGNIMLNRKGKAILIDFGASKIIQDDMEASRSVSTLCYTPRYAPGEQIAQAYETFGPWTDLYALGATLYYISTAQLPPNVSDISEEGDSVFKFPPTLSDEMKEMILWLMRPQRRLRPSCANEVHERRRSFFSSAAIADLEAKENGEVPQYPQQEASQETPQEATEVEEGGIVGGEQYEIDPDTGEGTLVTGNPAATGADAQSVEAEGDKTEMLDAAGVAQSHMGNTAQMAGMMGGVTPNASEPKKTNFKLIIASVTLLSFLLAAGIWWMLRRDHFTGGNPVADTTQVASDTTRTDSAATQSPDSVATTPSANPAPSRPTSATAPTPTTTPTQASSSSHQGRQNSTGTSRRSDRSSAGTTSSYSDPVRVEQDQGAATPSRSRHQDPSGGERIGD